MPQYSGTIIYLVVVVAIFYFLIVRPQMARNREQAALMSSLAVGDQVITAGGMYGTIRTLDEDTIDLEVAPGVLVKVARGAIAKRLEA